MPIYEFTCKACSHNFEGLYPVGTKADTLECPVCKEKTVKRVFSAFAVSSKGGSENSLSNINTSSGSKCGGCSSRSCSTCH